MPTYLCHGFRWLRQPVRIFVILNNLEDAAPDWVMDPDTATVILDQFTQNFDFLPTITDTEAEAAADPRNDPRIPTTKPAYRLDENLGLPPPRVPIAQDPVLRYTWSPVKLLEEYDPNDEAAEPARPYVYVADRVVRVDLGMDVLGEMAAYEKEYNGGKNAWFEKLRDALQDGADIGWYVVVCGDERRDYENGYEEEEEQEEEDCGDVEMGSASQHLRQLQLGETRRPATKTASARSTEPESLASGSTRPSQDQSKMQTDYSHMTPPPIPDDDRVIVDGDGSPGHRRRPSLRRRLSKASGLRRLFGKKDGHSQEQTN